MKTRWIVLLADGLLALALAFALLALGSGKPARTGETFELPASPASDATAPSPRNCPAATCFIRCAGPPCRRDRRKRQSRRLPVLKQRESSS